MTEGTILIQCLEFEGGIDLIWVRYFPNIVHPNKQTYKNKYYEKRMLTYVNVSKMSAWHCGIVLFPASQMRKWKQNSQSYSAGEYQGLVSNPGFRVFQPDSCSNSALVYATRKVTKAKINPENLWGNHHLEQIFLSLSHSP